MVSLKQAIFVLAGIVFTCLACSDSPPVAPDPAGKATDDDCAFCALLDTSIETHEEEEDGQVADNEAEADSALSDDETDSTSPEVVSFADANLERVVRWKLKKPEGSLTVADLDSLVRIDAEGQGIKSLAGIEHCAALDTLNLRGNEIEDLSALSSLASLTFLSLSSNQIEDISALSSLTGLKWLSLWGNEIEDISPLSALTKLTYLTLSGNQIEDVSPLSGLVELRWLHLSGNKVVDVSALDGLAKLEYLGLLDNPITNIAIGEVAQQVPTLIERDVTISLFREGPPTGTQTGTEIGIENGTCIYPDDGALVFKVGISTEVTLPEPIGGTPPFTYTVSGLPAGLSFDADPSARILFGNPTAAEVQGPCGQTYTVIYRATDSLGSSSSLPLLIRIVP